MPFVNGQFVYNDDFNYGDRFRQAYDGAQLRSATRDARRAYADGDADRAAEILTPYDMERGQAYATLADKTALRNAGRAYAQGNYEEAGNIFGERGNVQGVVAARTAGNNAKFARQLQTANRYRGELRRIKAMPPEAQQPAYEQLLAKAGAEAEGPEGQAFIAQLRQQLPQWGEEAFNAIDNILLTTAQAYATDSPEAFVENWVAQRNAAREEERLRLEGRKVDALEDRTEAQIARMERMGSGDGNGRPPSGYRWAEDGTLQPIPGGPADKGPQLAGGDAVRASNALASITQISAALKQFKDLVKRSSDLALLGVGREGAALTAAHRALALRMKGPAAFDLGALVGADFNILNDTIGEPGNVQQLWGQGGREGMLARLDEVEKFLSSTGASVRQTYAPYADHLALRQYYQTGAPGAPAPAAASPGTPAPAAGATAPIPIDMNGRPR